MKRKRYIPLYELKEFTYIQKLDENLRLSDLMKSSGMSDFTKDFRNERNKIMSPENRVAKLILGEINQEDDYVLFQFNTPSTDKYPNNYKHKATAPTKSFELTSLPSKTYTMEIKILKFFEWLDTTPENITDKDIEDVLEVADIQAFCNCPSFHWQGMNYNMSQFDASSNPTDIPPDYWSPKFHHDDQFLCKHLGGLLNSIRFFIPQMRQKIKKSVV